MVNFNKPMVSTFTKYRTEHWLSPDGTEVGVGVGTGYGGATWAEENMHKLRFE